MAGCCTRRLLISDYAGYDGAQNGLVDLVYFPSQWLAMPESGHHDCLIFRLACYMPLQRVRGKRCGGE